MSKTALKSASHSISVFIRRHGALMSFEKQHGMRKRLGQTVRTLHENGYILRNILGLKPKHIDTLVAVWKQQGLSPGTVKNRLADLRYVCRAAGKTNVVKSNADYDTGSVSHVARDSKAVTGVDFVHLSTQPEIAAFISDEHLRVSLALQQVFGLRREECLKIRPHLADRGDVLWLKGSWTKGKVERCIPIRSPLQRECLDRAKALVSGSGDDGQSLIPENRTYIQQRGIYDRQTRVAGLTGLHGLRHAYAQQRYREITGQEPPVCGGRCRADMTAGEQKTDRSARLTIANELGHSRVSIAASYLG